MIQKIRKAIFPIAGLGTRFLPMTKAMPKEMLPIIDKPLIQYAVEEAIAAGVTELIFITNNSKEAVKQHFTDNVVLEDFLKAKGDLKPIELVKNIIPKHVRCHYIYQEKALGLGHAILCAKDFIKNEPFIVSLADDLIAASVPCLLQMVEQYKITNKSILAVEEIPIADSDKYGMVKCKDDNDTTEILGIIEKPQRKDSPSNIGVVGRYIFNPAIFKYLEKINFDNSGEIQLTPAIATLLQEEKVYSYKFTGTRYDCGNKMQYVRAIIDFALQRDDLKNIFSSTIMSNF